MTSSLIGFFQQDIKKIIAYSTMSQLGMMVIAIGLSCYNTALFHLINHAFYKALLFLGAGSVIHAVYDNQDLRKYGGLKSYLPLTYTVMLIASLSLIALPFMTGFYSKDLILESAYGKFFLSSLFVYSVAIVAAIFTTLYSIKILYLSFFCNPNGLLIDYKKIHESNFYMSVPLIILSIFSIIFGYFTKEIYIGLGSDFFSDNSIYIHPINEILIDTENMVPVSVKILPFLLSILFFIIYIIVINIFKIFNLAFLKKIIQ
jgi:NADH-ubiquinone oxidoreductase chain 5